MLLLKKIRATRVAIAAYLSKDPKAIFDHVRNVGIAGAMILGAGLLRERVDAENQPLTSYIPVVIFLSGGVLLLIMNLLYAQKSINTLMYGKKRSGSFIQEVRFAMRMRARKSKLSPARKQAIYKSTLRRYFANWGAQWLSILYFVTISMLIMVQFYSSKGLSDLRSPEESAQYQLIEKLSKSLSDSIKERQDLNEELKLLQLKAESQNTSINIRDEKIDMLTREIRDLKAQALLDRHHAVKKPKT